MDYFIFNKFMDESHKSRYVSTLSKTLCIYLRKKEVAFETS